MTEVCGSPYRHSLCSIAHAGWSEWDVAALYPKTTLVVPKLREVSSLNTERLGVIGRSSVTG